MKNLKFHLGELTACTEEQTPQNLKSNVDAELALVLERINELAEKSHTGAGSQSKKTDSTSMDLLRSLNIENSEDIVTKSIDLQYTRVGHILDA